MNLQSILSTIPETALCTLENLPYPKVASGKVREIYDVGEALLLIATDRISAFDVVLPDGVPGKGVVLTQISRYWFDETASLIDNHLVADHDLRLAQCLRGHEYLIPRSMLVRKLRPLPIEAVVRGYLSGSGWKDYLHTGTVFGQAVGAGLLESAKLPFPIFTPTTKAAQGQHDEPISLEQCAALLGHNLFEQVHDLSLRLYALGAAAARKCGILLADTKFEFGTDADGRLFLIDEVLTPDSSRFWPAADYRCGGAQPSFDKQYVRDFLEGLDWNKKAPGPRLPSEVIQRTQQLYLTALEKLVS